MKTLLGVLAAALLAAPCCAADLYLDLRTDYAPRTEFRFVRVELIDREDPRRQWVTLRGASGDFLRGERIAELTDVEAHHSYLLVVELLDQRMRTVDGRPILLDMPGGAFAATVLMAHP